MSIQSPTQLPIKRVWLIPDYRDSVFEGYAIRYLHTNFWKFQKSIGEWNDAVSEAALCYYWTRSFYAGRVYSSSHFMSLFKLCLRSWFTDWANWDTKVATTEAAYVQTLRPVKTREVPFGTLEAFTTGCEGTLIVKLREASKELQSVLLLIAKCPEEIAKTFKQEVVHGVDQFFPKAVVYCGLPEGRALILQKELLAVLFEKSTRYDRSSNQEPVRRQERWFDKKPITLKPLQSKTTK